MALTDYKPETRVIEFKGGSFEVKGLSLDEITVLVRKYLPDLDKLFALAVDAMPNDGSFGAGEAINVASRIAIDAPGLAPNIIALASDSPDEAGVRAASKLGIALQIEALVEIGRLTFEEVGGIKKFVAFLIQSMSDILPAETQAAILTKAPQLFSTKH